MGQKPLGQSDIEPAFGKDRIPQVEGIERRNYFSVLTVGLIELHVVTHSSTNKHWLLRQGDESRSDLVRLHLRNVGIVDQYCPMMWVDKTQQCRQQRAFATIIIAR